MTDDSSRKQSRAENWAPSSERLKVSAARGGGIAGNVEGRRALSPLQGFGQMWQKSYWVSLKGVDTTPQEIIAAWKEHFASFWPRGNRFFAPLTGIQPGEVALLTVGDPTGRVSLLSTGVMVLYSDEESFTFMTPEGHMFAGWITFSAYEAEESVIARVQLLIRANDPLYEVGFRLGGGKQEDRFWLETLRTLAKHFGVAARPEMRVTCVDPNVQWSEAKNIWHNAGIRSALHWATAPLRRLVAR